MIKGDNLKYKLLSNIILSIIIILIFIAGVSADSSENKTDILSISKGGLSITYPSTWSYSESTSPYSIFAISKLDSIDSAGVSQVNINFEKKPIEGDFETFVNESYMALQSTAAFELVSSGGVAIGDRSGLEYIYVSNENGVDNEHKAVWFEKNGQAYVLLYSAPIQDFEPNLYVFDYILSDIKIT